MVGSPDVLVLVSHLLRAGPDDGRRGMTGFLHDIEALIVTFLWVAAVAIILTVIFW